jgi:hypothetical protein
MSSAAPESSAMPDLFAIVEVVDEHSLGRRLIQHGHDLYLGSEYPSYTERLRACIVRNGAEHVIAGRNPDGKPESYAAAFARVTGKPLIQKAPRGAKSNTTSEST